MVKVFLCLFFLNGGSPKVFLTVCAPYTGVSYGQKAMKLVIFILHNFSNQRVTDLLPPAK